MKKIIVLVLFVLVSAFFANSAMAASVVFELDESYTKVDSACTKCNNCLPEYLLVWGKGEKGVKWFIKNHYGNLVVFLKDVYVIPEKCRIGDQGHMYVRKDETLFLKSKKIGISDKYYRFVSRVFANKNKTAKNILEIPIPDNMPNGKYWVSIVGTFGTNRSQPATISFTVKNGEVIY